MPKLRFVQRLLEHLLEAGAVDYSAVVDHMLLAEGIDPFDVEPFVLTVVNNLIESEILLLTDDGDYRVVEQEGLTHMLDEIRNRLAN
jgi:hypothetical protein